MIYIACSLAAVGIFCLGVILADIDRKKRKPNIRVPRETLWGRTRRYHGDTQ